MITIDDVCIKHAPDSLQPLLDSGDFSAMGLHLSNFKENSHIHKEACRAIAVCAIQQASVSGLDFAISNGLNLRSKFLSIYDDPDETPRSILTYAVTKVNSRSSEHRKAAAVNVKRLILAGKSSGVWEHDYDALAMAAILENAPLTALILKHAIPITAVGNRHEFLVQEIASKYARTKDVMEAFLDAGLAVNDKWIGKWLIGLCEVRETCYSDRSKNLGIIDLFAERGINIDSMLSASCMECSSRKPTTMLRYLIDPITYLNDSLANVIAALIQNGARFDGCPEADLEAAGREYSTLGAALAKRRAAELNKYVQSTSFKAPIEHRRLRI